jgi:hypothetical protein
MHLFLILPCDHCLKPFDLPPILILLIMKVLQLHDGVIKVGVESCYKSHLSCIAWSQVCISDRNQAAHSSSTSTGKVTPHSVSEMVSLLITPCKKSPSSSIISPRSKSSPGGLSLVNSNLVLSALLWIILQDAH